MNQRITTDDVPPLEICNINGQECCLNGNRRLLVLKMLEKYGLIKTASVERWQGSVLEISLTVGNDVIIRNHPEVREQMESALNVWLVNNQSEPEAPADISLDRS